MDYFPNSTWQERCSWHYHNHFMKIMWLDDNLIIFKRNNFQEDSSWLLSSNTSRKYWKRRNHWETSNGFNLYPSQLRFLCSIEMIYFQLGQNPDEWTMTSNIIIRSLDGWKIVDMTTLFRNKKQHPTGCQ